MTPSGSAIPARGRRTASAGETPDAGIAMVTVVLLVGVLLALALAGATIAAQDLAASATDRKAVQAVDAAEAGVDRAYAVLQSGTGDRCAVDGVLAGGATPTATYTVSVAYYDAAGTLLACNPVTGPPATATTVLIRSRGSTAAPAYAGAPAALGDRTVESLVRLRPDVGVWAHALFSHTSLVLADNVNLSGDGSSNASSYAQGNFDCDSNSVLRGPVRVPGGTAQIRSNCVVDGAVSARGAITVSSNGRINLDASSSRGGITVTDNGVLHGDATAAGAITTSGLGQIDGVRRPNATGLPDPVQQTFPYIAEDASRWPGWEERTYTGSTGCAELKQQLPTFTSPQVVHVDCPLAYSGINTVTLQTDVVLFLRQGFTASDIFTLRSSSAAATRRVWLIVPAGSGPQPAAWPPASCAGPGITTSGNVAVEPSIRAFYYSPLKVSLTNNSTTVGQMYGCSVSLLGNSTMTFSPVSPPGGWWPSGATGAAGIDIVYKREGRSP